MNTNYDIRCKAVKCYFRSGLLDECAQAYKIHPHTLRRWINWYRQGGEENLKRKKRYVRPWNRCSSAIEQ